MLIPEKSSQTLVISDPLNPGNYQIDDRDKKQVAAFSVNVRPEESILDKVPTADLEKVLGEKSVVPVNHKTTLRSALQTRPQPMDLFPWLMLLLLLILAMENLISNRRRDDKAILPTAAPVPMNRMTVLTLSIGVGIVLGLAMDFFDINGSLGSPTATVLMGLLGLCHGLLMIGRFRPRDSIILGVILGSLIGILFGGLMLPLSGMMRVILGMLAGAAVFALDGWIVSRNATA